MYTIKERLEWNSDEQWELIHGIAYALRPAPRLTDSVALDVMPEISPSVAAPSASV